MLSPLKIHPFANRSIHTNVETPANSVLFVADRSLAGHQRRPRIGQADRG